MPTCNAAHPKDSRLRCSVLENHDRNHQCYFGNQLHEWSQVQNPTPLFPLAT